MTTCAVLCPECPFRPTALRGWLGPTQDPGEFLREAFSEKGMPCHMVVNAQEGEVTAEQAAALPVCRGSLDCANASGKRFRNPELAALQEEVRAAPTPVLNSGAFYTHHTP